MCAGIRTSLRFIFCWLVFHTSPLVSCPHLYNVLHSIQSVYLTENLGPEQVGRGEPEEEAGPGVPSARLGGTQDLR